MGRRKKFGEDMRTQVIAHRGDQAHAPENTMLAFLQAVETGADGIELDVHMSRDRHLVVCHDETVTTIHGERKVGDLKLTELRRLDMGAGQRMPTLPEVFGWAKRQPIWLNVEIKGGERVYPGIARRVCQLIRKYGMLERCVVSSFDLHTLKELKKVETAVSIGFLTYGSLLQPWLEALKVGAQSLHPFFTDVSSRLVYDCHRHGLVVYTWTVDDSAIAQELMRLGVDGIMTNDPAKLVQLRDQDANRNKT